MILEGDAIKLLATLPSESVHCCVTSPPYWGLRDYGVVGQLGLEKTPEEYVATMVEVFKNVRRVLRNDGTLWLNIGDCYASGGKGGGGSFMKERRDSAWKSRSSVNGWRSAPPGLKHKDLVGIPWMLAFALRADGWYLRSEIIWHKSNCLPESVTDRPTKAHEHLFLLSKLSSYYFDIDSIREPHAADSLRLSKRKYVYKHKPQPESPHTLSPKQFCHPKGKNKRSVWKISTKPFKSAHFATFPPALVEPCILAGSPTGGTVLDPFFGAGTVGLVARRHGREFIGIELNPKYCEIAKSRIENDDATQLILGGMGDVSRV